MLKLGLLSSHSVQSATHLQVEEPALRFCRLHSFSSYSAACGNLVPKPWIVNPAQQAYSDKSSHETKAIEPINTDALYPSAAIFPGLCSTATSQQASLSKIVPSPMPMCRSATESRGAANM